MSTHKRFPVFFSIAILLLSAVFFSPLFNNLTQVSSTSSDNADAHKKREEAYRANNLGVAQLEQYNHQEAVEEFRRALKIYPGLKIAQLNLAIALFNAQEIEASLREAKTAAELSPELAHPFYLLGLIAKNENRVEDAVANFQRVLEKDPLDVGTNINLGQIYIQQREYLKAVPILRRALAAEPYNSTAMYNLATVLLRTDSRDEGKELMKRFQELRQSGAATSIGLTYLDQGRYAVALVSTGAETDLVDRKEPKVYFQNKNIGLPVVDSVKQSSNKAAVKTGTVELPYAATLIDFDNDGDLDLATDASGAGVKVFRNDDGKFKDVTETTGDLKGKLKTVVYGFVPGDYDNDNFPDLLVFGDGQTALFRNTGKGSFENVTKKAEIPFSSVKSISGAFFDADHDGDLDIILGGFSDDKNKAAANQLFRNDGDGTFTDISEAAKIDQAGQTVAVVPTDFDNRRDVDFLLLNRGEKPSLFRNLRDGSFVDVANEVSLGQPGDWTSAAAGDFNKDTYTDFFFGKSDGRGVFAVSNGSTGFEIEDAPKGTENASSAQFLDYDNDGLLDLAVGTDKGFAVARNLGNEWSEAKVSLVRIDVQGANSIAGSRQILSADVDSDGDVDLFAFDQYGSLHFLENVGGNTNNSRLVRLKGRVSNRTGTGAKIEMRAGSLTQKLESYSASPSPAPADINFGLGKREVIDAVRVIWTSGVVQAEIELSENGNKPETIKHATYQIEELDRKPSSCPYLYTWNGERFEFVTDFLGGGEMGNWKEAGVYHYPDPDEYVRITSDQLKPKDGRYEIRVTNELEEVLFLDHLKLIAVEHDADTNVYPNEGLGIPTAGNQILYTTRREKAPVSAKDSRGRDVLDKITTLDYQFYDDFESLSIRGYAKPHTLTLDLGQPNSGRTLLLLTGWTDYAFSSDNLAASQSGKSLFMPKLQVKNKRGEWQTAIERIGISVGRPQTLVVDLTGKFLSDSREVRIVTNFKTYWDKIAIDNSGQKAVKTFELSPSQADLRERGFSEEVRYGEMISANYDRVLNDGRWKYFTGRFTKVGAVDELLSEIDDIFVISKTGDELVLSFKALPEPPRGKTYTYLLFANGYSKEMDINSGSPDSVFSLPFRGMKAYPYGKDEKFPMTEKKLRIYNEYTTRSVRTLLPRLESAFIE